MAKVRFRHIGDYRMASFYSNKKLCLLEVWYGGNMGSGINNVKECAVAFLGYDPYDFEVVEETGSPDYSYTVVFNLNKRRHDERVF